MPLVSVFRQLVGGVFRSRKVSFGMGRVLAIWRKALSRGLRSASYATAGWVSLLTAEAAVKDPLVLLGLSAGPLLELAIERGGEWLEGPEPDEDEKGDERTEAPTTKNHKSKEKKLNWSRAIALSLLIRALVDRTVAAAHASATQS